MFLLFHILYCAYFTPRCTTVLQSLLRVFLAICGRHFAIEIILGSNRLSNSPSN